MAARKKSVATKKKPAPNKKKPVAKKRKVRHLTPVPDSREAAIAWFGNLSKRISTATVAELKVLAGEARTHDLVGLSHALQDEAQVLSLNRAANELIDAALGTLGAASPVGFQLQVIRDILNDS
jgi:hypothetical protein